MRVKGGKDRSSGQSDVIFCLSTLGVVILISSVSCCLLIVLPYFPLPIFMLSLHCLRRLVLLPVL